MEDLDKLFGDAEKMVSEMKNKKYQTNASTPQQFSRKANNIENNHPHSAPERINKRNNKNQKTQRSNNNKYNNQRTPSSRNDNTPPNKKSPYNKNQGMNQFNDKYSSPVSQNFYPNNNRNKPYKNNSPNNYKRNSPNPRNNVERDNQSFGRDKYSSPTERNLLQKFSINFTPIQFVKGETLVDLTREECIQAEEIPNVREKLFSSFSIEKIFPPPDLVIDDDDITNDINVSDNDNDNNVVEANFDQSEVRDDVNLVEQIQNMDLSDSIQIKDEKEIEVTSVNSNVIKVNANNNSSNSFIREIDVKCVKKNKKSRRNNQNNYKNSSYSNNNKSIPIVFEGGDDDGDDDEEEEEENLLDQFNLQSLLSFCKHGVDEQLSPPSSSLARLSNLIPNKAEYFTLEYYYSSESDSEDELEYNDDSDEVEIEDEILEDVLDELSSDYSTDESDDEDDDSDDDEEDDLDELIDEIDEEEDLPQIPMNRKQYKKIKISENGKGFIPRVDIDDQKMQKRLKAKLGDFELLDENFNFIDDPLAKLAAMKKFDSIVNGSFKLKNKGKSKGKKSRDSFGSQKEKNQNNYYDMKKHKKNKKQIKKVKSKNKLNTKTIDIFAMNREIKKFVLDDENYEFLLPPMRKSCLSHVHKLAEYYSVRVTSSTLLPAGKLKVLQKSHKTKMPSDSDLQNLNEYIRSFDDFIGQRGKQLGKRKDQRLSGSPSDAARERKPKGHKSKLVAESAPPIESTNVGYILLKGMGWEGGALSQSVNNSCDRIYSTPDGKPLTTPLPAIIKIGKNGIGF